MSSIFTYTVRKYDNYTVSAEYVEQGLNDLGKSGWELVSVIRSERYTECFFKRTINIVHNTGPR